MRGATARQVSTYTAHLYRVHVRLHTKREKSTGFRTGAPGVINHHSSLLQPLQWCVLLCGAVVRGLLGLLPSCDGQRTQLLRSTSFLGTRLSQHLALHSFASPSVSVLSASCLWLCHRSRCITVWTNGVCAWCDSNRPQVDCMSNPHLVLFLFLFLIICGCRLPVAVTPEQVYNSVDKWCLCVV